MNEILKTLLYSDLGNDWNNVAMLLFRCLLAWELFRVHGLKKFNSADETKEHIPNPLHLPEKINAGVAIAADTIVPFLLALGCLTRVVVLPTIGVTAIGYFVVHRKDSLEVRDVPYMYTLSLLLVLALGAGTYSVDNMLLP